MLPFVLSLLHTANDMFGAFLTPLLPRLQANFGVSYAAVSLLVAVYSFTSSLLQPLAGLIADRYDRRLLAALGPLLVAVGSGLMGFYPNPVIMAVVLGVAGLGSALFHAAGAALVGQYAPAGRKGFWLSFFGSSGQLGLSLGPIVSIGVVSTAGLRGLAWVIPAVVLPALLLFIAPAIRVSGKPSGFRDLARVFRGEVAKLWGISTFKAVAFISFATTIPFWFTQRGMGDAQIALALTTYNFSAAAGAFLGGTISDRLGRKAVIAGTMLVGIPLYASLLAVPPEAFGVYLVLLALSGAMMNASIPVTVVMAQEHEPQQIATVSGLLMGFTWGFAGLLYGAVGPLIERFGVVPTLASLGLLLLPALQLALRLKEPRRELEPPVRVQAAK
jgi:FSR family fosmidomycin resistance protein-like MFS transporter